MSRVYTDETNLALYRRTHKNVGSMMNTNDKTKIELPEIVLIRHSLLPFKRPWRPTRTNDLNDDFEGWPKKLRYHIVIVATERYFASRQPRYWNGVLNVIRVVNANPILVSQYVIRHGKLCHHCETPKK